MAKRVGVDIDEKLWRQFTRYAKKRGMLIQAAVAEALRDKMKPLSVEGAK